MITAFELGLFMTMSNVVNQGFQGEKVKPVHFSETNSASYDRVEAFKLNELMVPCQF